MNRRSFLGFLAAAPLVPIAAKLPAAAPLVMRYDVPAGELYGVSPMMTATEVMRRHNEAIAQMVKVMADHEVDVLDCIDWERVHQELGAYGIATIKEEPL